MTTDPIDHLLLRTSAGILLASVDAVGVVVFATPLPSERLLEVREAVKHGGIYLVAFNAHPGHICALEIRDENGERVQRQMARLEVLAAIGAEMVALCGDIAASIAERHFTSWQDYEAQRIAALRALTVNVAPGEA